MSRSNPWQVWDPFLTADHLTARQRTNKERGEAWECYGNGGGGDPRYFDFESWIKGQDRQWENQQEHQRQSRRR